MFREIMKAEFFFFIITTLKEFYNIFQNIKFEYIFNNIFPKIYLFLRGMFLFVLCISLILVFCKFFIQSKVFPDFKKVKNHYSKPITRCLRRFRKISVLSSRTKLLGDIFS